LEDIIKISRRLDNLIKIRLNFLDSVEKIGQLQLPNLKIGAEVKISSYLSLSKYSSVKSFTDIPKHLAKAHNSKSTIVLLPTSIL